MNLPNADVPNSPRNVAIIGGGLAGLAAATALAPRGFQVTLFESRNQLGGRAGSFTDPATGQMIDACQHVSMGCCTNFAHFCKSVGIDHFLAPQRTLYFMTRDRRLSRFEGDPLPAPLHLARSLLRAHYLTLTDKLRIGFGMLQLLRANPDDDQPLLPWLQRNRQNQRTIDRFWGVVLISALNESIDRLGLKYARKVFRDGFLRDRKGYEVSIPTVPLGRFYSAELNEWLGGHDVVIETSANVASINVDSDAVHSIEMRDGRRLTFDWYVSAVPFDRLLAMLSENIVVEYSYFAGLRNLEVSPITSVHLWFDRSVMHLPHVVLVDCLGQWVFNRGETAPGEHYLQVVISAANSLKSMGHEAIQEKIVKELRELFPNATPATIVRARVITERSATFSPTPGVDRWRPTQQSPLANLAVAGDWTATGWPATMEGAVRSGYLAAETILRQCGRVEPLVQID